MVMAILTCLQLSTQELQLKGVATVAGGTEKSPDDQIWSLSARGEFFHSGSGIQNYGLSVASGLWGDCPTGDIAHLGVLVHEMAHQW
jgi:hypothetical protein